jgi:hypothetical protein
MHNNEIGASYPVMSDERKEHAKDLPSSQSRNQSYTGGREHNMFCHCPFDLVDLNNDVQEGVISCRLQKEER